MYIYVYCLCIITRKWFRKGFAFFIFYFSTDLKVFLFLVIQDGERFGIWLNYFKVEWNKINKEIYIECCLCKEYYFAFLFFQVGQIKIKKI